MVHVQLHLQRVQQLAALRLAHVGAWAGRSRRRGLELQFGQGVAGEGLVLVGLLGGVHLGSAALLRLLSP